jgi:hypothetical protein
VKIVVVEAVSPWSIALTVAAFVAAAIVTAWILAELSKRYRIKVEKVEA